MIIAGHLCFRFFATTAILSAACYPCFSQEKPVAVPFAKLRGAMVHQVTLGKLRVFYDTSGPHAVSAEDVNGNGVPDQPEDVAVQAWTALRLWTALGYPDPLQSPRYAGVAWIDVHLLSKELLGSNGVAYDELQRFARPEDAAGTTSLCFDVATLVKAPVNLTPAHEMFHLIQNGATFFKNRWFTEGTARWSERGLGTGGLSTGLRSTQWPPADEVLPRVFAGAYETALSYWEPLLMRVDSQGRLPDATLPGEVTDARYANGEPVLKDLDLTGAAFIAVLLKKLDEVDDIVHRERKLGRWPETEQKSPANDAVIHRCVMETARKLGLQP